MRFFSLLPVPPGFRACFPFLAACVARPWAVTAFLAGAGILGGLALDPIVGLALVCLGMPVLSLSLERKLLERILLPPFTIHVFWGALGCGVGVPILALFDPPAWHDSYLKIQLVFLASLPVAWICYELGGWRNVSAARLPAPEKTGHGALLMLGWGWFLASCLLQILRSALGLDNRGGSHPSLLPGWDSYGWSFFLRILPRFDLLGYFFVPLLWQGTGRAGRTGLATLLTTVLLLAVATGARGLMLYPACFIFLGTYFFRSGNSAKFQTFFGALVSVCLGAVFALLIYRSSPHYSPPRPIGPASPAAGTQAMDWKNSIRNSGYSFHGVEDVKVYESFPRPQAFTGWENFRAILYTWVPSYFARAKPVLLDGERVAGSVQNPPKPSVMGYGISLPADAYRRFGWVGIFPAVAIAFLLYGWVVRWLLNQPKPETLFAWGTLVLTLGFFQAQPFGGPILSTWHVFFYSLPKHLAVLWLGCLGLQCLANRRAKAGSGPR